MLLYSRTNFAVRNLTSFKLLIPEPDVLIHIRWCPCEERLSFDQVEYNPYSKDGVDHFNYSARGTPFTHGCPWV